MSQSFQIPLNNLKEWLEKETATTIEPLRSRGESLLVDLKGRLDDVMENCERMLENSEKEMEKGSPKTYRSAKAANRFAQTVSEIISNIVVPDQVSHANLQTLYANLEKTNATIEQQRRIWYHYISPYFIFDRRRLDVSLKRLIDSIQEIRSFATQKYVKVKIIEDASATIDKLLQLLSEEEETEKRLKTLESREKFLEEKILESQQKIKLIQARAELTDLVKSNERTEDLRESVKHNLRHLQKPFFKFQSLTRSAEVSLPVDEAKKLSEYLSDPFEALITEESGYPMLKRILRRVDEAINRGKLKLKSSRLRKAQEQIANILNRDSLNTLQRNCVEAYSQRKQLLTSNTVVAFQNELAKLQAELKELQRERELVNSRSTALNNENQKLQEKIEHQKKELEKAILQLTNKNVQIVMRTVD